MKKMIIAAAVAAISLVACQSAPKADEAQTGDQQQVADAKGVAYKVDSNQVVHFIGTKPVGQHNGSFVITQGQLFVQNDVSVSSGTLTLNMKSLKITDKDTTGSAKLAGHLSSPDFFEVDKFPTATFEITGVAPYKPDSTQTLILDGATHTVSGNLTLKGVTKNVSFPAIIKVNNTVLSAQANFNINRTDWGLVYGNDKSLGDKFIRPEVNISFSITATK